MDSMCNSIFGYRSIALVTFITNTFVITDILGTLLLPSMFLENERNNGNYYGR